MGVPEVITCIDCGGRAHRLSYEPHEGWESGMVVAYRCADCRDRWDLVLEDDDIDDNIANDRGRSQDA